MHADLALALKLADRADTITLQHFQSTSLSVRTKVDMTPVSEADEAVERMIRAELARERPSDGIVGEEFGTSGESTRRWIIDPIDGTKNYVRGIPVYATLIGVEEHGRLIAGVVSAPSLARRWWAAAGEGAYCNGRRIHVSRVASLDESHLTYGSLTDFDEYGGTVRFMSLLRRCTRARGFGDFWAHMLVAEGAVEIAVEPEVSAWDMAGVQIIVEEAGGTFTDLRGESRFDGGSAVSSNGLVHEAVLEYFK